jgi:phospholipase A-2-activating protein
LFEGREYDFVFDVDIQEGAPPLKLPYNANGDYMLSMPNGFLPLGSLRESIPGGPPVSD